MNEAELSKLIDQILSGDLLKPAVVGVLQAAAGALLTDTYLVHKRCKDDPRYQAAGQQWWAVSLRLLGSYDVVVAYFDKPDPKVLEGAFETASACWKELSELVLHLPGELNDQMIAILPYSFFTHDLEHSYTVCLTQLETLLGRTGQGALKRYVDRFLLALAEDDAALQDDFDSVRARKEYQKQSKALLSKLKKLAASAEFEQRVELYEEIEELLGERLATQLELVS